MSSETKPSAQTPAGISRQRSSERRWSGPVTHHQRAGAVVGEQFEQHRVRHLAVEDDDALDALLERVDAGLDLGDHAAGDGAVGDQLARVVDRQLA